jgi:hypothetical protein
VCKKPEKPQYLQSVLNSIPGNHLILLPDSPKFTIVAVTDSYLAATYTHREEIIGKGVFDALTDDTDNDHATGVMNLSASLHRVLQTNEPDQMHDQRYDVLNAEGKFEAKVWAPVNKPVFDEAREIQYIIHTVEDITERERLEEEKRSAYENRAESESRFRRMVEQSPIPIVLTRGEDVVIESINSAMFKFMNMSEADEVLGKKMLDVMPELKGQPAYETVVNVQKTGVPFRGDEVLVNIMNDGRLEPHYFNFSYTPVKEERGIDAVLHVATDVTQQVLTRKKLEASEASLQRRVAERTEELEKKNKELEEFNYAASHDMQEPLRKIATYTSMLLKHSEAKFDEQGRNHLAKIVKSVKRIRTLIDDLLLYSQQGTNNHTFETTDLNIVIHEITLDLDLLIEQKSAQIYVEPLPAVVAVESQMRQLFFNLISNAIKFSRPGIPPTIDITVERNPDISAIKKNLDLNKRYILISVNDNGTGFPPKYAENIFSLFARLHPRHEYEGTGIGLALCKKIAESHGGAIWAESTPGNGAKFHILLPSS